MVVRSQRKKIGSRHVVFVGGVIVVVLVIIFNQYLASVFSGVIARAGVSKENAYQELPKNILAARLEDAENELARIRYQSLLYEYEVARTKELQDILELETPSVYARGTVIARPPRTHYDTLLVSVTNDDLVVDDYVSAFGITVGTVHEVREGTALVSLYSSPGRALDIRTGEPHAITVMHGLGGGAFVFEISKEVALQAGDPVLFAQNQSVVAIVQEIIDEPERTTVTVYATAPVATADMRIVEFTRTLPQE